MIRDWIKDIITGVGGLMDYNKYELGGSEPSQDQVATWVLRCLANPECKGSAEVLDAIINRRDYLTAKAENDNPGGAR